VRDGAGVVIPSWTCAALLHAVAGAGGRPLVCDVEPDTLALDPDRLRKGPAAAARAVVLVHPFGLPIPVEPYRAAGRAVIEDCAQSPGARLQGRPVGSSGDASVFSFGPTKLLTCGGPGGGLASGDPSIVRTARDLAGHDEKEDDRPRLNGLMGDLHAAVAAVQIGRLPVVVTRRRAIVERYDAAFEAWGSRPRRHATAQPVYFRYLLGLPGRAGEVVDRLRRAGVQARLPVHRPLHRLVGGSGPCPGADEAQSRWLSLPLSAAFSRAEVDRVIGEVTACLSSRS
jgi:dTDP-4-amino-4,6-dideoxygalactose transaminase